MAWVSVHDNVIGKKLRDLAKELGTSQEEALGILVSLWIWSLRNADKDGQLVGADKEDVLEAFSMKMVSGSKVDLVDVLIKTKWMDEPEPGVLYIHDWDQWQEQWYKAIEKRKRDAERKAESRRRQREIEGQQRLVQSEEDSTTPVQQALTPVPQKPAGKRNDYPSGFLEFWNAYPRHVDKGEAYKKYAARRKDGFSDEELLDAAKGYAMQCAKEKTAEKYIKHPKTFLSETLPFTQYLPQRRRAETESQAQQKGNPFADWSDDR